MSELAQGLKLSVIGLMITFASLGLLILVMVVLRELFSPSRKRSTHKIAELAARPGQRSGQEAARRKAAGIAVSVAYLKNKKERGANLGQLLESPPGRWWGNSRRATSNPGRALRADDKTRPWRG